MNNSYLINKFQYKSAKQIGLMCLLTRDVKSIKVKSLSVLIHYACSRAQRFKALCHRRIHYGDIYSVYKIIFTSGRAAYVGFKNDFYSPIRHDRIRANHPWRSTKKIDACHRRSGNCSIYKQTQSCRIGMRKSYTYTLFVYG